MTTPILQSVPLDEIRPAEAWWLLNPMYSQPEPLFRDTIMFLMSCSAIKLVLRKENPDPGKPNLKKLVYPYIEVGPAIDELTPRDYENQILDQLVKLDKRILLRKFTKNYIAPTLQSDFRSSIRKNMKAHQVVRGFSMLGFNSLTGKGRDMKKSLKKLLSLLNKFDLKDLKQNTEKQARLAEVFRMLGHHVLLADQFNFKQMRALGSTMEEVADYEAGFFDEKVLDLPDLNVLMNLKAIDNVIYAAFNRPSLGVRKQTTTMRGSPTPL